MLQRQFGIAICTRCGEVVVLGQQVARRATKATMLCQRCQALPAAAFVVAAQRGATSDSTIKRLVRELRDDLTDAA